MIKAVMTKRAGIVFLEGLIYWVLGVLVARALVFALVAAFSVREMLDSVAAIAPFFWVDMLDMIFYFCSGLVLAAIFRSYTLILAVEVWVLESLFWLIVARPFAEFGNDAYLTPMTPVTNALASYVVVPACIVLGAAAGRKLVILTQKHRNRSEVENS